MELCPLSLPEVGHESRSRHWFRGGYPEAFGADSDEGAIAWLRRHVENLAEARFSGSGLPWAPGRTRNLLSMIAEAHGGTLNENAVAASIGVSRPTVVRSVAALERLGVLRLLPSAAPPSGARSVRSPALYLRDSGILHAVLGFRSPRDLMGSARLAASWEGYVIEEALRALPQGVEARRFRSKDGGGLELLLSRGPSLLAAASVRWARQGRQAPRGAVAAARTMASTANYLVLPEAEESVLDDGFRTISLKRFLALVSDL
jgi:predicted AAA+ superfamily ATPase